MNQPTEQQMRRVSSEWSEYAGEQLRLDFNGGELDAYGSELGVMRLFMKMRNGSFGYSKTNESWYYTTQPHWKLVNA